jgi:hypothetical protein
MQLANSNLIIKDHTEWFPNTSFGDRGPTLDWIAEAGYYVISVWKPYDHATEKLVSAAPHLFDGMCCLVDVEPLTADELQARIDTVKKSLADTSSKGFLFFCDFSVPENMNFWLELICKFRTSKLQSYKVNLFTLYSLWVRFPLYRTH